MGRPHAMEQGQANELQDVLKEHLKGLHIKQQHLQQAAASLCEKSSYGRSQAFYQVAKQQASIVESSLLFKQAAHTLQQVQHANTIRLQYDQAAADKVLRCMRLEQDARQLDSLVASRPYNRLHPRYSLRA